MGVLLVDSVELSSWLTLSRPVRRWRSTLSGEVSSMDQLLESSRFPDARTRGVGRTALGIVALLGGAAVVMVGMVLYGGNRSGAFPTFPFAGGLTMLLGASLMA